jgi:hypothetical protein
MRYRVSMATRPRIFGDGFVAQPEKGPVWIRGFLGQGPTPEAAMADCAQFIRRLNHRHTFVFEHEEA